MSPFPPLVVDLHALIVRLESEVPKLACTIAGDTAACEKLKAAQSIRQVLRDNGFHVSDMDSVTRDACLRRDQRR